jgi:hypothetical protein
MIEPISIPKPPGTREIRELTPEEVASVAHIFTEHGTVVPDLSTATFVGAVQDGKVLGFLVLQAKLHAEPLWIEPGHSHLFTSIAREAERTILKKCGPQWVYLFSPAGRTAQMATAMGMAMEPFVVMSKLVMPEAPGRPLVLMQSDEDTPIDLDLIAAASEATQ